MRMRLQGVMTVVMPRGRSGPTGSAQEQPRAGPWKENLVDGNAWWRGASCQPSWPPAPLDARGSLRICPQAPLPHSSTWTGCNSVSEHFPTPTPFHLPRPPKGQPVLPDPAARPLSSLKTTRGHPLS